MNITKIAELWREILSEIGEDPNREGLRETPLRIAKMYKEVFRGYDKENEPKLTAFPDKIDGIDCDDIIMDEGNFNSFCEHHCALFTGRYYFGYIPGKKVVGLSKIARVVDYFAARLQIQERLGRDIINFITNKVEPKGCILILEASHSCKSIRGVKKEGKMRTIVTTGIFRTDTYLEQKFISLIK